MARGIDGWSYRNVIDFITSHGFYFFEEMDGSHESWISPDERYIVEINKTKKEYPPRTLETMIGNSGLDKKHWRKWTTLSKGQQKKKICCQ